MDEFFKTLVFGFTILIIIMSCYTGSKEAVEYISNRDFFNKRGLIECRKDGGIIIANIDMINNTNNPKIIVIDGDYLCKSK